MAKQSSVNDSACIRQELKHVGVTVPGSNPNRRRLFAIDG
jgi:hypothetical protein